MTSLDRTLRLGALGLAGLLAALAWLLSDIIGPRGQAGLGALCFIAICAAFSTSLRAVRWRTIGWGMAIQLGLALLILRFEIGGVKPGYAFFSAVGDTVKRFLEFSNQGAVFVFGALADPAVLEKGLGAGNGFVFAFTALPTIIFISSFFTILYYYGVLQFIVWVMARAMMYALRTSGAETLSAAANVFMGRPRPRSSSACPRHDALGGCWR
jgi:CNT family concentrative nucleoside transporter